MGEGLDDGSDSVDPDLSWANYTDHTDGEVHHADVPGTDAASENHGPKLISTSSGQLAPDVEQAIGDGV